MNKKVKNFDEKRDEKISKLYSSGKYTQEEIGRMYRIGKERVRQLILRHDHPKKYAKQFCK